MHRAGPLRLLWAGLGLLALALGLLGVVLPLLPTTPFMLLAAWCFARSSERLHRWLLEHRSFGPMIIDWRDHRAIGKRAKLAAVLAMAAAFGISLGFGVRHEVLWLQAGVLTVMGSWIVTRPSGPGGTGRKAQGNNSGARSPEAKRRSTAG